MYVRVCALPVCVAPRLVLVLVSTCLCIYGTCVHLQGATEDEFDSDSAFSTDSESNDEDMGDVSDQPDDARHLDPSGNYTKQYTREGKSCAVYTLYNILYTLYIVYYIHYIHFVAYAVHYILPTLHSTEANRLDAHDTTQARVKPLIIPTDCDTDEECMRETDDLIGRREMKR
jgi:hypothetical protein